jgi:hypothetical protein
LHIHVVLEAPKELPDWWLILLKTAWNQLTGGEHYLNLQRMYSFTKRGKKRYGVVTQKALKEVCKYVTKCTTFIQNPTLVDEFLTAFRSVRRIQCCGSFFGAKAAEFERQPGEDESGVADETPTLCSEGYERMPFEVPISHTLLLGDGTRQLCFPYRQMVRDHFASQSPPWALSMEPVVTSEQRRIEFAGGMPEKSELQNSLFEDVA